MFKCGVGFFEELRGIKWVMGLDILLFRFFYLFKIRVGKKVRLRNRVNILFVRVKF